MYKQLKIKKGIMKINYTLKKLSFIIYLLCIYTNILSKQNEDYIIKKDEKGEILYKIEIDKSLDNNKIEDDIFDNIEDIEDIEEPKFEKPSYIEEKIRFYGLKILMSFYKFKNWIHNQWKKILGNQNQQQNINSHST